MHTKLNLGLSMTISTEASGEIFIPKILKLSGIYTIIPELVEGKDLHLIVNAVVALAQELGMLDEESEVD